MKWCLPCAVMKPPIHAEAVGENEDGDPACDRHRTNVTMEDVLNERKSEPVEALKQKRKYVRKMSKEPETQRQDDITAVPEKDCDPQDQPTRLETTNLVVTERMLDNFWARMTIDQKTRAVQDVLESYI